MSSETFSYKGISAGKYIEGEIEAINQAEASFKLKEIAMKEGFRTMQDMGRELILTGDLNFREFDRVLSSE